MSAHGFKPMADPRDKLPARIDVSILPREGKLEVHTHDDTGARTPPEEWVPASSTTAALNAAVGMEQATLIAHVALLREALRTMLDAPVEPKGYASHFGASKATVDKANAAGVLAKRALKMTGEHPAPPPAEEAP